jgi:methionyl-tRNA synthetase
VIRLSSILLQPYSPDLTSKILDFIGVSKDKRTFKYAEISEKSMQRNIVFDVYKKKEIFVNKYEEDLTKMN